MLCVAPSAADRDKKGPGGRKPPKAVLLKQAEARKAEMEALAGTEEGKVGMPCGTLFSVAHVAMCRIRIGGG